MANEKRLIDANALFGKLNQHHDLFVNAWSDRHNIPNKEKARIDEILNCIAEVVNAPTVDAVEVVHARWEQKEFWTDGGTWRCSECGRQIMFMKGTPITEHMYYCPECGSTMDGGNGDG